MHFSGANSCIIDKGNEPSGTFSGECQKTIEWKPRVPTGRNETSFTVRLTIGFGDWSARLDLEFFYIREGSNAW